MNTTQGVFFVVVQSPLGATGTQVIPIRLDYDIEFTGAARQTVVAAQSTAVLPSTTFTNNVTTYPLYPGIFPTAIPSPSGFTTNVVYAFDSTQTYEYIDPNGVPETISYNCIMNTTTTVANRPNGWVFGDNVSDMKEGKYITFPTAVGAPTGAVTLIVPKAGEIIACHPIA